MDVAGPATYELPTFTLERCLRRLPKDSPVTLELTLLLRSVVEEQANAVDRTTHVGMVLAHAIWELLPCARSIDVRVADELAMLIGKPQLGI